MNYFTAHLNMKGGVYFVASYEYSGVRLTQKLSYKLSSAVKKFQTQISDSSFNRPISIQRMSQIVLSIVYFSSENTKNYSSLISKYNSVLINLRPL